MSKQGDEWLGGDRKDFDQLPSEVRKEIWERMSNLYDWAATENSRGNETDMDDLIAFFAYETDPFEEPVA